MTVLERYEALKVCVVTRAEGFRDLIEFMEQRTSWLSAPASSRYHLNREGGLLEHSVNVAETMLKIKGAISPAVSDESCVVVSLIHDLGKVGMPENPYYLVTEPSEKQKKYGRSPNYPYRTNKNLTYLSVPVRSIYLALPHIALAEEEVQAIVYHDGQYVDDNKSVAAKEEPLTLLLQYADSWSGFVTER